MAKRAYQKLLPGMEPERPTNGRGDSTPVSREANAGLRRMGPHVDRQPAAGESRGQERLRD